MCVVVLVLPTVAAAPTAAAHTLPGASVTWLAELGHDDFVAGSTIGPDGALYVPDGITGEILRVDRRSGRVDQYASGLPSKAFPGLDVGGPIDVAFVDGTAYVLVTLVSGNLFGEPFGDPVARNGLYRIERNGTPTLVVDLGEWSASHPPQSAYVVDTGVHFTLEPYRGGFIVTDAHHNRLLRVDRSGGVDEVAAFDNVVPTGLEVSGGRVYVSEIGPIPHRPEDGKVLVLDGSELRQVASGASMLIDVERGPNGVLYGLSQGNWDGIGEGSRAFEDTGRLVVVGRHGELTPVRDRNGAELVLDRPTSLEFVGSTGYVVSVTGDIYRVTGL